MPVDSVSWVVWTSLFFHMASLRRISSLLRVPQPKRTRARFWVGFRVNWGGAQGWSEHSQVQYGIELEKPNPGITH